MVDVDHRMNTHAHVAGLKRLSARASKGPVPVNSPRRGWLSFAPFVRTVFDRLEKCGVRIVKGLSDEEFEKIEATFGFCFPPDLKAILREGLPVGVGFPDWRTGGVQQLGMRLNLPVAGLSYEVARRRFWTKQWGAEPLDTQEAVRIARAALKKAPLLVPVYNYCYIPCSPNLAGNPVFYVHHEDVSLCGYDLVEFFAKEDFSSNRLELPFHYGNLETIRGKTGSLGGGVDWVRETGRSFRIEKEVIPHSMPRHVNSGEVRPYSRIGRSVSRADNFSSCGSKEDFAMKNSGTHEDFSKQEEASRWKLEEPLKDPEAWGRKLDSLARRDRPFPKNDERLRNVDEFDSKPTSRFPDSSANSTDNSPRLAENVNSGDRNLRDRSPSELPFAGISAKSPGSAGMIARRIDFWSDLTERRQILTETTARHAVVSSKEDTNLRKSPPKEASCRGHAFTDIPKNYVPQWLAMFLEEMASILRRGGWKEEDIIDVFNVTPSPQEHENIFLDKRSVLEELVLHLNLLSEGLRRAGWSNEDVAEVLNVNFSLHTEKRQPSKIPPHMAARIAKLAEYIAQS
eukprot:c21104_g1_i2 orf=386-2095(+)